jgi:hypothetical protein
MAMTVRKAVTAFSVRLPAQEAEPV